MAPFLIKLLTRYMARKKIDSLARPLVPNYSTKKLPFETDELRTQLEQFLNKLVKNPLGGPEIKLGNFKWGVYSFYDYEGEPIYVGQTKESLRTRIRRHLTNQRTDAVAMNVLDPFEVHKVIVHPLPELQEVVGDKHPRVQEAQKLLDALEHKIYRQAIELSKFGSILNEKEPSIPQISIEIPISFEGIIVSDSVSRIREHPDVRIARRAQTISRLAQTISERKVTKRLREVLHTQAKRLQWLTEKRLGAAPDVPPSEADDTSQNDESKAQPG